MYHEYKVTKEMFYLTTHSTHFIYGYMASDLWLRTILIVRKETRCHHIGYSYWLTARVLLYASSHRLDNTYHSLCYTSRGALAGTRNSSMGPLHSLNHSFPSSSPCSGGSRFHLSLSEWSFTICLMTYNCKKKKFIIIKQIYNNSFPYSIFQWHHWFPASCKR